MNEQIKPWEDYETPELAQIFSDYFKDFHGRRPHYVDMTNRAELLHQLKRLDDQISYMKTTEAGSEQLRKDGWIV